MSTPKEHINRTPETLRRYKEKGDTSDTIDTYVTVSDFKHWHIIENNYPYDAVFSTHHMLMPKRIFPTLSEATEDELSEYKEIMDELNQSGKYDGYLANFHANQSKPKHYHLHLFCWRYRDEQPSQTQQ